MRTPSQARAFVLLAALGASSVAVAAPGDHIGGENATLVPSLDVGVQHRTNVYLQEGEAGGGVPVSDGTALYVNPAIALNAKSDAATFDLDFSYTARKFFQSDVQNLDRFNILDGGLRLNLLPRSPVGFKINDRMALSGYEAEDDAQVSKSAYQSHFANDLTGLIAVHPGGPLEVDAGGRLGIDNWSVPEEFKSSADDRATDLSTTSGLTGPGLNSRLSYGGLLRAKWRFFPKTAVVLDVDYTRNNWADNVLDAQGDGVSREEVGDYLAVPDSSIWRARTGLRGRVTDKLVVTALVGFGQALYSEDSVTTAADELGIGDSAEFSDTTGFATDLKSFPDGFLAEVSADYSPAKAHTFTVGYRRDFQDTYFTNYVGYDRLLLNYEGRFAERVGLELSGTYRSERYVGEVTRNDGLMKVGGELAYYVKDYLSIRAGSGWHGRRSTDGSHPEVEYDDVKVFGGLRFVY
ncbi:MAG: hypothetical protein H6742_11350 [Alphaproteobacteria bacterium]|nr:hypothetical protein [Alphaproteobacteria bacterium]